MRFFFACCFLKKNKKSLGEMTLAPLHRSAGKCF
jgi:hypothetical protein